MKVMGQRGWPRSYEVKEQTPHPTLHYLGTNLGCQVRPGIMTPSPISTKYKELLSFTYLVLPYWYLLAS